MPDEATTQVWMTVFSCLVKGCLKSPDLSKIFVHDFTKKKPSRPAETLSEGIIPVVRLSFITMKLNRMLSPKLTKKALNVSCLVHEGTSRSSKNCSIDSAPPPPPNLCLFFWFGSCSESKPFTTRSSTPFSSIASSYVTARLESELGSGTSDELIPISGIHWNRIDIEDAAIIWCVDGKLYEQRQKEQPKLLSSWLPSLRLGEKPWSRQR